MKKMLLLLLVFPALFADAQNSRPVSITAGGTLNFRTRGLGQNDAGFGLFAGTALFARNKLQLLVEASATTFSGDKLLYFDARGNAAKSPLIHRIHAGPQYHVTQKLAVAATYGAVWHRIRATDFTLDDGLKLNVTAFPGEKSRLAVQLFAAAIPATEASINYLGLGLGYRCL
jgi:hypothetical protein